jgi:3-phosphoshikimate 1-carboxyvinyltransferase
MMLTTAPGNPLRGRARLPGDKSISHRAILFSALADGESRITNLLVAGVTRVMLAALRDLGVSWRLEGTDLIVQGGGLGGLQAPDKPVDCGNSATTMRLLVGALAAAGIPAVVDGSPGLRKRPMGRIVSPLQQMGVPIEATEGHSPLILQSASTRPRPLDYAMPVASAQLKTCLLLAALAAEGTTTLREPGPSRDHTERMLRGMGVEVVSERGAVYADQEWYNTVRLVPPESRSLAPLSLEVPGDVSAAAFLIVAALVTPGSKITIPGVGLNPTRTGLLDALRAMGGRIEVQNQTECCGEPVGDLVVRHSHLRGTEIAGPLVVRMIDEFPVFAVAAAFASTPTVVREATELRYKESDRITVLCQELRALGVSVIEHPDGFALPGGSPPLGGEVNPHGDHRLAMSLVVAGLASARTVQVNGAEIIDESFPDFVATLRGLGAEVRRMPPDKTV